MAKRPAWHPSDIRDWSEPRSPRRPRARPAPPPHELSPETDLLVEIGRERLALKLRDLVDLLSGAERRRLAAAIAKGRTLSIAARPGRAAMAISARGGEDPAGARE